MSSKLAILILGLLAILLFISSEVAASDSKEVTNGVGDAKYPGGGYPGNGGGYGGYPGRGGGYPGRGGGYPGRGGGYPGRGGGYPGRGGGYPGRGGGRGGGYCQYGCCSGAYLGGCGRCCYYAGEAVDSQTKDNTHN